MRRNLETNGLYCEIVGLVLILFASLWQAGFTDWFDKFPVKSQAHIQETANLALLRAVSRTAMALKETDDIQRSRLLQEATDFSNEAQFYLIRTRDQVESVEKNQSGSFKLVRLGLFVLGALAVVLGKTLVAVHKSRASAAAREPQVEI